MKDFALLAQRVVNGGLMAGHGSQKLFGWFGGPGLKGTAGIMEALGLKPAEPWAALAAASEFGGGVLTAIGFLNPLGPLGTVGAMTMATARVHWGKPVWAQAGGAELPLINIANALALGLLGPGKYSVDHALNIHLPRRLLLVPGLALTGAVVAASIIASERAKAQQQPPEQVQQSQQIQPEEPAEGAVPAPERPATEDRDQQENYAEEQPEPVFGSETQGAQDTQTSA